MKDNADSVTLEAVAMGLYRGLPLPFNMHFPRQITLVRRPKDGAHHFTKEGRNQIVEFPILSLAEI